MGRGKPFKVPLSRLVAAGVVRKPIWLDIVEATRPPFQAINQKDLPAGKPIVYPEDRLREIYLQRNPDARRVPVNLNAPTVPQRHIADKFVSIQVDLMENEGMQEDAAYDAAFKILEHEKASKRQFIEKLLEGPLADPTVKDENARLFLASLSDSHRDQKIFAALVDDAAPPLPEEPADDPPPEVHQQTT